MSGAPRGRKPFPKGEAFSRMLSCRVRPDEEAAIRAAAKAAGLPVAQWIRSALLRAAKVVRPGAPDPARNPGSRPRDAGGPADRSRPE